VTDIFKKEWKVLECFSGKDCWCRMIGTIDYTPQTEEQELVIGAIAVNKQMAEYIVDLHNKEVKQQTI
jgi:hypothetical protein